MMPNRFECQQCGASFSKVGMLINHRRQFGHKDTFPCTICQKTFGRRDNLDRHMLRHRDGSLFQCNTCGLLCSRVDSLQRHTEEKHTQTGGGSKRKAMNDENPVLKRHITRKDNPEQFYDLRVLSTQPIPKFNTTTTRYKVSFKELEVQDLPQILKTLRLLFGSIINNITEFMQSTDLIRLSVQCPELDFPITIPFMKVSQLSVETLLREIERVLQSYEQFVLDDSLEIEMTHVELPVGGTRNQGKYVDLERFMKTKQCILTIRNKDDLCCARALVTAKANLDKHEKWNSIRQGRKIQEHLAIDLHTRAHVPLHKCGIEEIKKFQAVMSEYQIHVVSKEHFNGIIFQGPEAEKKIYLYFHDEHFDVITSMPAFLSRNYNCHTCKKGYQHKEEHRCNNICTSCHKIHEKKDDDWIYCNDCNRHFYGEECYRLHAQTTRKGNSTCKSYIRCKICSQTINKKMHKKEHICGEIYCKTCKDFYEVGHLCFMLPVEGDKFTEYTLNDDMDTVDEDETKNQVYIFFDFECTQDDLVECEDGFKPERGTSKCKNCKKSKCGTYEHKPNLCVVQQVCLECLKEDLTPLSVFENCGKNELIFSGMNTTYDFCQWLFSGENNGATVICHNFKGYDSFPILQYLYQNGVLPKIVPSGAKNMSIEVPSCNIRMIDSLNFLPMALSKLPKMFGIKELQKGYFPHLYNRKENQTSVLNQLPDVKFYNPDAMKSEDRENFLEWYQTNVKVMFDFQKELLKYCRSDVDILRRCCLRFRELFMSMTKSATGDGGIDPFETCITIASACNLVFRTKFLRADTIGIIPAQGYRPEEKHSVKAIQWIKYISQTKGVDIQHARNGREKIIDQYRVDGFYENSEGEKIVLEYHGCFWHGCPTCYTQHTINTVNKLSMEDLYHQTMEKKTYIEKQGYIYTCIWECEFDKHIKEDENIKKFIDSLDIVTPLEPRDAFAGGRTEAFNLYHESSFDESIKYYDVTSLYPYINKTGKAVIGHPRIVTENFDDLTMYEGLIKCKVYPPRGLHIPVLPAKINNKLMFSLCRTCTEIKQQTTCRHGNEERSFTGTWVTDELKMAVNKGYILSTIYEVWHFDEVAQYDPVSKTGGIFTEYINTFLKMKQEASGWPSWCITKEHRQHYIQDYYEKEGILLDYNKIEKNPGLRALAKLMLNSFWGKFGQRTNLPQVDYVSDPSIFFDMLTSDQQEVTGVNFVPDEMVEMRWRNKAEFVELSGRTNVVLAAYTTSQARLKLYSYLEQLGQRVLYADTDSIVFTVKEGEWEPSLGDYLGDLTDEVPENKITHFVTGGPKNYAYKLHKPDDRGNQTICKVRGVTLNYKNALSINFETVREMVTNGSQDDKITVWDENKITRDKQNTRITTSRESKDYKIVFDKRVITEKFITKPYGY